MMTEVTQRISRYLLARLRRAAIHDIYEHAAVAGLLESAFIDQREQTGLVWRPDPTSRFAPSGNSEVDRMQIGRLLRRAPALAEAAQEEADLDQDDVKDMPAASPVQNGTSPKATAERAGANTSGARKARNGRGLERDSTLRLLRSLVPLPAPADAAVVLSLAQAVGRSVDSIERLLSLLRQRDPMIVVSVPMKGFERRFGKLLELGRIISRVPLQADGFDNYALSGRYQSVPDGQPRLITFAGDTIRKSAEDVVQRMLAKAMAGRNAPVLLAHQGPTTLSPKILAAADLVIKLDGIDQPLLAAILEASTGITVAAALASMNRFGLDPANVGLNDLVLSVRPGRTIDDIIAALKLLGTDREPDADESDEEGKDDGRKKDRSKTGKSKGPAKQTPRFDIVAPETTEPSGSGAAAGPGRTIPRVETLTGYGEARGWALDLKSDLALWRRQELAWVETSSRLLLHGPPGTGKTTFARALCNSLDIPMVATSLSHWLEPGYLGDVLQLMSAAFETARSHAPSILFIDEIDNIGRRGGDGQNSDYWDSLVNRMLELLDGVGRLDGVIVIGATNIPDRIDKALLRSGRLERHIELGLPDTEALAGILRFHLGRDLDNVIRSRPPAAADKRTPASMPSPAQPATAKHKRPTKRRQSPKGAI